MIIIDTRSATLVHLSENQGNQAILTGHFQFLTGVNNSKWFMICWVTGWPGSSGGVMGGEAVQILLLPPAPVPPPQESLITYKTSQQVTSYLELFTSARIWKWQR